MKIIIYLGILLVFVTQESGSISTRVLINQSVRVVWFGETSLFLWTFAFWGGRAISLETVKICIIPIVLQNLLKFPQRWLAIAAAVTNALSGDGERRWVLMELRNLTLSYKSFRRKFPRSIWRNWLFHLRDNNIFAWLRLQRSSNVDLVFARNIFIDEMFVDWCLVKGEVKQDNVQDCVGDPGQGVRVTWSKWVGEADYVTLLFKNIAYVIGSLKCFVFVYLWILLDWTWEYCIWYCWIPSFSKTYTRLSFAKSSNTCLPMILMMMTKVPTMMHWGK